MGCSLGAAACYLLLMLMCATLMTSSHSEGPDLFGAGWDDRWIPDTLTDQNHSLYNIKVFADATKKHDGLITPRCCGC